MDSKYEHLIDSVLPEKANQDKIDHLMALAAKISEGISAKGWTKSHFAKIMDQHPSVITKWLSGTNDFQATTLLEIQQALNIPIFASAIPRQSSFFHSQKSMKFIMANIQSDTTLSFGKPCKTVRMPLGELSLAHKSYVDSGYLLDISEPSLT